MGNLRLAFGIAAHIFLIVALVGCTSGKQAPMNANVHPALFRDRDALLERVELMHDFDAFTYSEEQLDRLRQEPESKDYKKVVARFVTSELKKDPESIQTISDGGTLRTLVVITTDRSVYRIGLKKLDDYDGIYIVDAYAELIWRSFPVPNVDEERI
jgi:Tfp pilus assembly protein PilP